MSSQPQARCFQKSYKDTYYVACVYYQAPRFVTYPKPTTSTLLRRPGPDNLPSITFQTFVLYVPLSLQILLTLF